MPNVKAIVKSFKHENGKLLVTMQFNEKVPKISTIVTVHWGRPRSLQQNALYWAFLNWCIEHGGLKNEGHFSADALHLDLKAYFLAEKIYDKGQFRAIEEVTTTTMGRAEFSEYFTKVEEFIKEFFEIDTAGFWKECMDEKPISIDAAGEEKPDPLDAMDV